MPLDKSGKFHMNTQRAMAADKNPMNPPAKKEPAGDGGKPAEHGGNSVHEHMAAMHAEHGGKHFHHMAHEDGSHTTHHVGEDGQVQGPHEHPDMEAVQAHHASVMGGGHEPEPMMAGAAPAGGMDGMEGY